MALAVANRSGGKTSERGLYDFIGSSTTGYVVSGFAVRENSPLGMSVRIGGIAGTRDTLLIRDGLNTQVVFTDDGQPVTASVSPAHASLYRIDRVVVYIDKAVGRSITVLDNNNGVVKVVAVAGNPDSQANAVPPTNAMIQSAIGSTNKWTVLGDLTVAPGVTQVTQSAVVDRREMLQQSTKKPAFSCFFPNSWAPSSTSSSMRNPAGTGSYTSVFDNLGNLSNAGVFTAPVAGVYRFNVGLTQLNSGQWNNVGVIVTSGGKTDAATNTFSTFFQPSPGGGFMQAGSGLVALNAGDTVQLGATNSAAANFGGGRSANYFMGELVTQ